jgi:hypothetical protein
MRLEHTTRVGVQIERNLLVVDEAHAAAFVRLRGARFRDPEAGVNADREAASLRILDLRGEHELCRPGWPFHLRTS